MDYSKEIDILISHLEQLGRSQNTIDSYVSDIKQFANYCNKNNLNIYEEINIKEINKYKKFLEKRKLKITTINRKLISIRLFLSLIGINFRIRQEKVQKQNFLDDIMTSDEISNLIDEARKNNDIRAVALMSTLFYTGMRISEALTLDISDINRKEFTVRGKGKYRTIFIPSKLNVIWKEYSEVRKNTSEALFTGQKGAMTRQKANVIIKYYAKLCNIDLDKAHCHMYRHFFCKRLVDSGIDISTVADIVGHSDINITKIYTRKTKEELKEIISKL